MRKKIYFKEKKANPKNPLHLEDPVGEANAMPEMSV
jgi:hypothetical protein